MTLLMATIKHFEELEIWKMSRILCTEVYNLIIKTELKNDYKLKDQINGSSGSVMDNIAEGFLWRNSITTIQSFR